MVSALTTFFKIGEQKIARKTIWHKFNVPSKRLIESEKLNYYVTFNYYIAALAAGENYENSVNDGKQSSR